MLTVTSLQIVNCGKIGNDNDAMITVKKIRSQISTEFQFRQLYLLTRFGFNLIIL